MTLMEMIPSVFPLFRHQSQCLCREEPLPDQLLPNVFILLFKEAVNKRPSITVTQVFLMQLHHMRQLFPYILNYGLGKRHSPVLLSLPVMDRQDSGLQVKIVQPELHALKEPQPASVQNLYHQIIRIIEVVQHEIHLIPGQDDWYISGSLGPHIIALITEICL